MYAARLIEIGKEIGGLDAALLKLRADLGRLEDKMKAREKAAPAVGANADERKASKEAWLANDPEYGDYVAGADAIRSSITQNEMLRAPLDAERRALEYAIRDHDADAVESVSHILLRGLQLPSDAEAQTLLGVAPVVTPAPVAPPSPSPAPAPARRPVEQVLNEIGFGTPAPKKPVPTAVPVTKDTTYNPNESPF